ncbi:MAG: hypothetical protein JRI34_09440 [Deltaproteobacteria bacterium]|nr:hypothetical protein [Deltaproteobacteria bacterium]
MGRRDKWKKVTESMAMRDGQAGRTIEERERMPDVACGKCKNFSENAHEHDGRGSCGVLKMGSDILADPPVFVTEGDAGLITYFNWDAAKCPHFSRMSFIDTDIGEVTDPAYQRAHRQMEKK